MALAVLAATALAVAPAAQSLSAASAAAAVPPGALRLGAASRLLAAPRPANCPPVAADPNTASPGQVASLTGTFSWPALPGGTNPEVAVRSDHTPTQFPPLRPANWANQGNNWKLTSARSANPQLNQNPQELCGVKGNSVDQAWQVSTGSPTTVIAITDSGIEWCDPAIVNKIYLNRAALPVPENSAGATKAKLSRAGSQFPDADPYDLNGSGVFNVSQYVNDPRVAAIAADYGGLFCSTPRGPFPAEPGLVSPMDLIRAFGTPTLPDGAPNPYYRVRSGPAGFVDAIAGWNFVDNNNNPYDQVHYDHGTGEAMDSTGAANNINDEVGSCPNCLVLPVRVGDSFIAQANTFAEGVLFAVDSGATVIQEALGTLDVTETARQAIGYAAAHGVPVIASAADEEAQHHNLPAVLSHTIVVNSITDTPQGPNGLPLYNPPSYLYLNGCTNYGANIAVSVESASCSSEATGKTGGITGLAESAAAAAVANHVLAPYPGLRTVSGTPVALSVNEVKQLITMSAADVDFQTPAPPWGPPDNYLVAAPVPTTRYRTQPGFDTYTGYGRVDAGRLLQWISHGMIPPQAEITNLPWFQSWAPAASLVVRGLVGTPRPCPGSPLGGASCPWREQVQVGVGTMPERGSWHTVATGSGSGVRSGVLARIPLARVAALFPAGSTFTGGPAGVTGRPDANRFTFTVRVVVQDVGSQPLVGMARRAEYLHTDSGLVFGHPLRFGGSIDAAPTLAPLGPGGTNVLLVATTDGTVHALLPSGRELPGWPVRTAIDSGYHRGELAYRSGAVTAIPRGAPTDVGGGLAVGDLANANAPCLHGPHPSGRCLDVVFTDVTGRVYAFTALGRLLPGFPVRTNPAFSGPSVANPTNRLLRGFLAAASLADLQGNNTLDIVAAAMDRHVYAWQPTGRPVPGWPVLVVDRKEVSSINPVTNQVTFRPSSHVTQGSKLIDTPAIGNLTGGGGPPDVLVGSSEEYSGPLNVSLASPVNFALGAAGGGAGILNTANSRVYAIAPTGNGAANAGTPFLAGWPAAIGDVESSLLPDVGDGVTNSPALASPNGAPGGPLDTAVISAAGPGYLLNPSGGSALGTGPDGKPIVLSTQPAGALSNSVGAVPSIPALGAPVIAPLGQLVPGLSVVAPALSLGKALDVAAPADQHPHDNQVDAWSASTGRFLPAFPQVMNDLQFFDQPLVADVGGATSGPYVVEASATYDLRAVNAAGQEAPGFPKITGGWVVNSPAVGAFGSLHDQVIAVGTREGNLFVWSTPTVACAAAGPWPMAHHDLFNSNNLTETSAPSANCVSIPTGPDAPVPPTVPAGPPAAALAAAAGTALTPTRRYRLG